MLTTLLLAAVLQTPPPTPLPKVTAGVWDYPDALVSEAMFYVSVDGGTSIRVDPTTSKVASDPGVAVGNSSYAYPLPPLTVDVHSFTITVCSKYTTTICSTPGRVDFRLVVTPVSAVNPRVK